MGPQGLPAPHAFRGPNRLQNKTAGNEVPNLIPPRLVTDTGSRDTGVREVAGGGAY
ncbi:hypothetical protein PJL15_01314 [Paenarthrobacter nitroguajacolicus]|nr:hypothetical protein [Paenarthrobacter nitroguajacolicus]